MFTIFIYESQKYCLWHLLLMAFYTHYLICVFDAISVVQSCFPVFKTFITLQWVSAECQSSPFLTCVVLRHLLFSPSSLWSCSSQYSQCEMLKKQHHAESATVVEHKLNRECLLHMLGTASLNRSIFEKKKVEKCLQSRRVRLLLKGIVPLKVLSDY